MTSTGVNGVNHMDFVKTGNNITGYAVSYFGQIVKYSEDLVGINPQPVLNPVEFKLYQNYPNPFNPSTKISFSVSKASNIHLVIYNSLGQEIAELMNKFVQAGQYSIDFNALGLPSGIYFYKLNSEYFTETKKMLLIK
jgi:hypothetical protein